MSPCIACAGHIEVKVGEQEEIRGSIEPKCHDNIGVLSLNLGSRRGNP